MTMQPELARVLKSRILPALAVLVLVASPLAAQSDTRLIQAVKRQDAKAVRELLPKVNVNATMPDGTTALHWAAHWNDVPTVDALIRAGANVNAATDVGVTPLWLACSDGGPAIVTSLLKAGAKPNLAPPSGESPLMAASRTGQVESVRALLASGADVNARDASRGQTALMWAAAQRHAEVVRALLIGGADVNARSAVRRRLGFVAGNRNGTGHNVEEQRRLSVEFDEGGYTALLFAAQQDDVDSAKILVEAGADVNDTAPVGTSALVVAVHSDSARVAEVLLERGADVNADGAGYTALHAAVLRGNAALVTALLARGASPNAKLTRPTPARRYGNEWSFGDNLIGATPFYLAAKFGEIELMRTLAAAKADPSIPAQDGSTPLMMALDTPTVRAGGVDGFGTDRRDRYGLINDVTPEQLESDAMAIARAAIELGANVNQADANGNTALHQAASKNFNGLIEFLVARGAQVNAKNRRGQTPLALAEGAAAAGAARRRIASGSQAGAQPAAAGAPAVSPTAALLRKLGATD
jgi:ankyrin repeat protein